MAGLRPKASADPPRDDSAVVRCFATMGVRGFITRLAWALMSPAGAALR